MNTFAKWITSIQSKLSGPFVTIFLLLLVAAALESGLRANRQDQHQPTDLPKSHKDKIILVSLGDSVSAGYPPILEHILNSPNQTKFIVQNQYKTVFKSGTLQRAIEALTLDNKPSVILLMLGQFGSMGLRPQNSPTVNSARPATENSIISKIVALKLLDWAAYIERGKHFLVYRNKEAAQKKIDQLYLDLSNGLYLTEYSLSEIETTESILHALQVSLPDDPKVLVSKYYLSLISQDEDEAQTQLNLIKSSHWNGSSTEELDAFFQLEFGASPLTGFNILSKLLTAGQISPLGCLVFHARKFDSGQIADSDKVIDACHILHPNHSFILFKLFESKRINGELDTALRLAALLEKSDWPSEKISRVLLKQYYYLAVEISKSERPQAHDLANEVMRKALNHSIQLILLERLDEPTIRTFFWAQRFLTSRGVTFKIEPAVAEKVEKHSQMGAYAAIFRKLRGQEDAQKKQAFADRIFMQEDLVSDESPRPLDLPAGLLKALEAQCNSQVTLVLMQPPNQSPDHLLRATDSLKCRKFVDTRETLRIPVREQKYSMSKLFQEDGLHLTELGNELIARKICTLLRDELSGAFAAADCQRPL
ncbi:MAG: hypothetical protein IPJ84_13675 [Bdellovibrionales bacterium]|nr:hypothetical protein [Bdellovibrionales bacterium]